MCCAQTRDDHLVFDGDVTRKLHDIGQNHIVPDVAIMSKMHVGHEQTVFADGCLERVRRSAIDRGVFANHGALPDLDRRFLSGKLQILWRPAQYGSHSDLNVLAELDVSFECRARGDNTSTGNHAIVADDRKRADFDIGGDLGVRRDDCRRVYPRRHRSRTIAAMSASATTSPSTLPTPRILQTVPRSCVISSSKRIWSPGFTGRRNFTLSRDMK